jgi:hypothetical protein
VGAVLTTLALMYQSKLLLRDDNCHRWNVIASWPQQKHQLQQLQPHHHTKTNNNISIVNEKKQDEFIDKFMNFNNRSKSSSSSLYRWDDPVGIRIESLWQYMQNLVQETLNAANNLLDYYSMNGPIPAFVDSSSTFLVESQVYGRRRNVRKRFYILEPFLQQTLSLLLSSKALNLNTSFETVDQRFPWKDKKPMADVWRGVVSGTAKGEKSVMHVPRIQLLQIGKQHPQVLDVALACTS